MAEGRAALIGTVMISNQPRRRFSVQQVGLLHTLQDGKPQMAIYLGDHVYRDSNRKQQQVSVKRALRHLERWSLVRIFYEPRPDSDMTLPDYIAIARTSRRWHGKPPGIFQMREQMGGRIAPFSNRKQPVLWAQITDAGQDYLLEQEGS